MPSVQDQDNNSYFPESSRTRKVYKDLVLHVHPTRVRRSTIAFSHTWGLGGMALILFLLQLFTGLMLRFVYEASPEKAYESILSIQDNVFLGGFVRNIHHYSGMFLVVVAFLHMLRVFFTGAYKPPRHINWIIGIALMLLVVLSNFSGYLLPWDQLSYWAVTVATGMLHYIPFIGDWLMELFRGGPDIGPVTLVNFYNFHTAILPLTMVILLGYHFWKVRKAGGVVVPGAKDNSDKEMVPVVPHLVAKEFVVALVLTGLVFIISALWDAPLLDRANPSLSPNPAKAPWYFLGIQELLMHFHPFFAAFVFPSLFLGAIIWFPFTGFRDQDGGTWFASQRGQRLVMKTSLATVFLIVGLVLLEEWIPEYTKESGTWSWFFEGVLPSGIILMLTILWIFLLHRKFGYQKSEIAQGVFVFYTVAYVVLTIFGIWFRGEGMALVWPWLR
jgi:quinol-cytochrome oxidoreductase complex cytochrome b subunit